MQEEKNEIHPMRDAVTQVTPRMNANERGFAENPPETQRKIRKRGPDASPEKEGSPSDKSKHRLWSGRDVIRDRETSVEIRGRSAGKRPLTPEEAMSLSLHPRSISAILQHPMPIPEEEREYCIAEKEKVAAFRPVEPAYLTKEMKRDILSLTELTRGAIVEVAERNNSFFGETLWYVGRVRHQEVRLATEAWVSGKRIFEAFADAMMAYREPAEILEDIRSVCEGYLKVIESPLSLADMQKFCLFCTEIAERALAVPAFRDQMCLNALSIDHQAVVEYVLRLLVPAPSLEALRQSPHYRIAPRWRKSTEPSGEVLDKIRRALLLPDPENGDPENG